MGNYLFRMLLCIPVALASQLYTASALANDVGYGYGFQSEIRQCLSVPCAAGAQTPLVIGELIEDNARRERARIRSGGSVSAIGADFMGNLSTPLLRASAYADPGHLVVSSTYVFQEYRWEGAEPVQFGVTAAVSYTSSGFSDLDGFPGADDGTGLLVAYLTLYDPAQFERINRLQILSSTSPFRDIVDSLQAQSGSLFLSTSRNNGFITLLPGQRIGVAASFQMRATSGGFVDSFNTLRVGLDQNLPPDAIRALRVRLRADGQVSVIPEPTTWSMLLAGCLAVGIMVRRQSRTIRSCA